MLATLLSLLISTQAAPAAPGVPPAPARANMAATPAPRKLPTLLSRFPILAEGAQLVSARGYIVRSHGEPGMLVFILDEQLTGNARRSLVLLPCDPTDEVAQMVASPTADTPWRFEVSGAVYDYSGRAFLLPAAIIALRNPPLPPLLSRATPPEYAEAEARKPARAPALDAYMDSTQTQLPVRDEYATLMEHEAGLASVAPTDDDFANELERRLAQGTREIAAPKPADTGIDRTMIMHAATRFQDRRAMVVRDPVTGTWRAVLETAAAPDAPLAMEILPCRQLERVDRIIRQSAVPSSWLLSGEVVVSGQRNYLILTMAQQMPHDHWMAP
jgi:hypothetical protein